MCLCAVCHLWCEAVWFAFFASCLSVCVRRCVLLFPRACVLLVMYCRDVV